MDGSSPYIYDRRRVSHETCVRVTRRWQGVFDPSRAVLWEGLSLSNMHLKQWEKGVLYGQMLRKVT